MSLLFDCRSCFSAMGGIGRMTECLACELSAAMPDVPIILLVGVRKPERSLASGPNVRILETNAALIDPVFEQITLPGLLEEHGVRCYMNPCFSIPIAASRVKRVAWVHDVIFRRHAELVEPKLRAYLDRATDVSCDLADAIITVSKFSAHEITALYGCPAEKITVVPNAVEARFFEIQRRPPRRFPFVLYVGSLEEKKNITGLVRGFAAMLRAAPSLPHHLVLAGSGQHELESLVAAEPVLRDRVHAPGHVPEAALLSLYAEASAFCYVSLYEGFGLPPLEAMAAGIPTLVSNTSSLPEVVGEGALLVDPMDHAAIGASLQRLVTDRTLSDDLVKRGKREAARFSWRRSAEALARIYRSLTAGRVANRGAA